MKWYTFLFGKGDWKQKTLRYRLHHVFGSDPRKTYGWWRVRLGRELIEMFEMWAAKNFQKHYEEAYEYNMDKLMGSRHKYNRNNNLAIYAYRQGRK